jgi:hypothetical protein
VLISPMPGLNLVTECERFPIDGQPVVACAGVKDDERMIRRSGNRMQNADTNSSAKLLLQ